MRPSAETSLATAAVAPVPVKSTTSSAARPVTFNQTNKTKKIDELHIITPYVPGIISKGVQFLTEAFLERSFSSSLSCGYFMFIIVCWAKAQILCVKVSLSLSHRHTRTQTYRRSLHAHRDAHCTFALTACAMICLDSWRKQVVCAPVTEVVVCVFPKSGAT